MDNPTQPLNYSGDPEPQRPVAAARRHPVRVTTIVWGAVVLTLGILIILSTQLQLNFDAGLTAMWLLLGAGVIMVVAGAVNLLRKRDS